MSATLLSALLQITLPWLEKFSAEERLEFVAAIRDKFCLHCGNVEGVEQCRCWDDS